MRGGREGGALDRKGPTGKNHPYREDRDRARDYAGRDGECRGKNSAASRNLSRERRRDEPLRPPRIMIDPIVG